MKRIFIFLLCVVATLNVAADELERIKELFAKGDYDGVKKRVEYLHKNSPIEYDEEFVEIWYNKCNKALAEEAAKKQAQAKAKAYADSLAKAKQEELDKQVAIAKAEENKARIEYEAQKQKAQEEKAKAEQMKIKAQEKKDAEAAERAKQEKRKEMQLWYLEINSERPGFENEIESYLKVAGNVKIANLKDDASKMLLVDVTETITETAEPFPFRANVTAEIQIVDLIENKVIFKKTILEDSDGGRGSKYAACEKAYANLSKTVSQELAKIDLSGNR